MAETEKKKALDAALLQIEKQFGKGAIMRLGQNSGMSYSDRYIISRYCNRSGRSSKRKNS